MSVGARLREERLRLGLSQPAFAALAGASKGAQAKWEKDDASPNAVALIAFAEAGADVLYVLTGKRTEQRPETAALKIEEELKEIERDLVEPTRFIRPGQTEEEAEQDTVEGACNRLRAMLKYDRQFMSDELAHHVEEVLYVAGDPAKLSLLRAADFAQKRQKRERMKESLSAYVDGAPYEPNDTVRNLLVMIAMEYGVPVKVLAEVIYEIFTDITDRQAKGEQLSPG